MNRVESLIHRAIGDYPWLREPIVNAYQRVLAWVPRAEFLIDRNLIVRPGYFFGFHDKCPWPTDGKYLLAHKFDFRAPIAKIESKPVTYGIFEDGDLNSYRELGTTEAWNWQQGASLQWVAGTEHAFAVNSIVDGKPLGEVRNENGKLLQSFPYHLASVCARGRFGVSYCFRRLGKGAPGYGYHLWGKSDAADWDELHVVDLYSGRHRALLTLNEIASIEHCESMKGAYHFFSHALFSPTGDRFLFYHQWRQKRGHCIRACTQSALMEMISIDSLAQIFRMSRGVVSGKSWRILVQAMAAGITTFFWIAMGCHVG